jgi:protein ImuA
MSPQQPSHGEVARLRELVATTHTDGPVMPFGMREMDDRLPRGGLNAHALHEFAPGRATLGDAAATALFAAGIAARAGSRRGIVLWALRSFDLYAPGLEQAGLPPDRLVFAEVRKDEDVLALAEDGLRHGSLAAVVAEVRRIGMTQTRRLQLAASEGRTPMLLIRAWHRAGACPLADPSSATTRWRVASVPSAKLPHPGVGRGCWSIELVRQRNGAPFSITVEACDDQGRLALLAPAADRAAAVGGAAARAA